MRTGFRWLACLAIALFPLAGCDDSEPEETAHRPSPADVVPRAAVVYAESIIRLRGEAGRPARRFAAALTGLSDIPEDALIEAVADLVDEDIDVDLLTPWLGTRAGGFVIERGSRSPTGAIVFEATDTRKAARFIRETLGDGARSASYQGVRFRRAMDGRAAGVVAGKVVVAGSVEAMQAAISARRSPLASSARYRRARGNGRPFALLLASARVLGSGPDGLIPWSPAERREVERLLPRTGEVVIRASVGARQAVARIEGLRPQAGDDPEPIGSFPADAWLAASSADLSSVLLNPLGDALGSQTPFVRALEGLSGVRVPNALLREMRRGTIYFQGTPYEPTAQLLADVAHPRATGRAIVRFARTTERTHFVHLERVGGDYVSVVAEPRGGGAAADTEIELRLINGGLIFELGSVGGGAELRDKPAYREARRALGQPPTVLLDMRSFLRLSDPSGTRPDGSLGRLSFVAVAEGNREGRGSYSIAIGVVKTKPREPDRSPSSQPSI